jgi:hypothetical protein
VGKVRTVPFPSPILQVLSDFLSSFSSSSSERKKRFRGGGVVALDVSQSARIGLMRKKKEGWFSSWLEVVCS